jgi:hypothetical protein
MSACRRFIRAIGLRHRLTENSNRHARARRCGPDYFVTKYLLF